MWGERNKAGKLEKMSDAKATDVFIRVLVVS